MAKGFTNKDSIMKTIAEKTVPKAIDTLLNNPYYLFNDKTISICTYYNLNTTMTTLDEATRDNYGILTENSPLRFNKINGFYIYGISKIEPSLDINEYGLEGDNVESEAIILPNTIVPYPGDRFTLNQLGDNYIFEVISVNPNTLETGAVMYKVNYRLCGSDGIQTIEDKVVKILNFMAGNIGTNFATFIEEGLYDSLGELEKISKLLKDYYIDIFYDVRIQTFAYYNPNGCIKIHDPYLLEFIIRNNVLDDASEYLCLHHQLYLPNTFGIDYDRTIFSSIENNDITHHIGTYVGNALLCTQKLSLLYAYPQDYYYMEYRKTNNNFYIIDIFNDPEFGMRVKDNNKYENDENIIKNIIIGYFNGEGITIDLIEHLKHLDYENNMEYYYLLPIIIFIIDQYIEGQLINNKEVKNDK